MKQNEGTFNKKEYFREYYKKNKERLDVYLKSWHENNPTKKAEYGMAARKRNGEKISSRVKQKRKGRSGDLLRHNERKYRSSSIYTFLSHKYSQLKKEKHHNKKSDKYKLDISLEYLMELWSKQDGKCAITGKQMEHIKNSLFSASVDRIDPKFGYLIGNAQLVCQGINFAKNKYSDEQIRYFWYNDEIEKVKSDVDEKNNLR